MKEYVSPNAELIEFENNMILALSNPCNCGMWVGNHQLGQDGCDEGTLSDASEAMIDSSDY